MNPLSNLRFQGITSSQRDVLVQKKLPHGQSGLDVWQQMGKVRQASGNPDASSLLQASLQKLGITAAPGLLTLMETLGLVGFNQIGTVTMVTPDGKGSKVVPTHQWRLNTLPDTNES